VAVRGVEIPAAAERLARHLKIEKSTQVADGSGDLETDMKNQQIFSLALSANTASVEPFRQELIEIMKTSGLMLSQLYIADETGLFYSSLPENTQVLKHEGTSPGRKL
jgi:hypothetical protein